MKLRYYLRGIGTGMIVTALILSIALGNGNEKMTEEQIKAKAAELGMVEEKLLSDIQNETEKTDLETTEEADLETTEEADPEATENATTEATDSADDNLIENVEEIQVDESAIETAEDRSDESVTQETATTLSEVTIEVKGGESSVAISKKLEEAGIVTSAAEYDKYLCDNGYDKKICVGTHVIPEDADYPEIAKILTSKQ